MWALAALVGGATMATASPAPAKHPARHGRHRPAHAEPAAAPAPAPPPEAVEEVESVDLDEGQAPVAAGEARGHVGAHDEGLSWRQVIAHLHPAMVHLPIAWTVLWALWEALALRWPDRFRPGTTCLAAACALSFLPATATGLLHLLEVPDAPEVRAPALLHRNLMFAAEALGLALLGLRYRWRAAGVPSRAAGAALVTALALEVGLVGWAAHLGGRMVHGDDYLPF